MKTTDANGDPVHPGHILRSHFQALGYSNVALASMLGLSRQTLHDLMTARQGITPGVALRVAKLTGTSAELWLGLQQAHDLMLARRDLKELLEAVPVLDEPW